MDGVERLIAAEDIRNLKGAYCRGVDRKEGDLLRGLFARDAVVDYRGALIDPTTGTGVDQKDIGADDAAEILRGPDAITHAIMTAVAPLVTVHHCAAGEIHVDTPDAARAVWPMVDRLRFPPGSPFKEVTGYGFYHETYVREGGAWKIATVKLTRTRVDVTPA